MKPTIQLDKLSIGYQQRNKTQKIVATDIDACLFSGQLTCLIGSNGVGKSTLLRTIAAFQPRLAGEIFINTETIDNFTDKQLSKTISVVLTTKPDVQNMKTEELVGLGRNPYTGFWGTLSKNDEVIVSESMEMVGISHLNGRKILTLSDGERQKVMIAKALAQQTPIIILDEPTAFLDYPSKVEIMLLLLKLSREADKTIFLSTHDMELALQTADKLWLMTNNNINIGTAQELADNGKLNEFLKHKGIDFDSKNLTIKVSKNNY